jgi:hypothetical protein
MTRIPGLAKLISTLIIACKVIDTFSPGVRLFVPAPSQAAYDDALAAIKSACDVVRAIDYADDLAGTNPLWGSK